MGAADRPVTGQLARPVSRRAVLGVAAGGAAVLGTGLGALGAAAASGAGGLAGTADQVATLVGSTFHVRLSSLNWVPATLTSVEDTPAGSLPAGRLPAWRSLLFRSGASFPQGTYAVSHPSTGVQQLLVVPVGRPSSGQTSQVVINLS